MRFGVPAELLPHCLLRVLQGWGLLLPCLLWGVLRGVLRRDLWSDCLRVWVQVM